MREYKLFYILLQTKQQINCYTKILSTLCTKGSVSNRLLSAYALFDGRTNAVTLLQQLCYTRDY